MEHSVAIRAADCYAADMDAFLFPDMKANAARDCERPREAETHQVLETRRAEARENVRRAVGETRFALLERQLRSSFFILLEEMTFWEAQAAKLR